MLANQKYSSKTSLSLMLMGLLPFIFAIYYLEKYDINEELIRLESNLRAFDRCLELNKPNGKKLGFISQELSREINTIGSKCNDATIQKYVIEMKDNLEKIRENILNIL